MRPTRPCAVAAVVFGLLAVYTVPAQAACKRFGFLVNDYGKQGPTKDAKALLDKHIKKWANEQGITDYQVGKKQVTCELYLDVGLFDEYTCTAKASVCWGDDQAQANAVAADDDHDEFEVPPAPVRKAVAAPETAVPVAAAQDAAKEDVAKTAEQAAEEAEAASKILPAETKKATASTAGDDDATPEKAEAGDPTETAAQAAPSPETESAKAKPAAAPSVIVETGALPTNAKAAAAEAAKTSPEMTKAAPDADKEKAAADANERAAAAEAAAAAAERAAKAAEEAAAAAKAAAAAAIAASEASQGPVVPALKQAD